MYQKKKLKMAIHLYGHMRTFKETHHNFFKNIVFINNEDYDIDIFIHTWNKFQEYDVSKEIVKEVWHSKINYYPTLANKPLSENDIKDIFYIYKPKKYVIEERESGIHGVRLSLERVYDLRKKYENEKNVKYDAYLYTRPDLMFKAPIRILGYVQYWKEHPILDTKIVWCGHSSFSRMYIADPRVITESDLFFFSQYDIAPTLAIAEPCEMREFLKIPVDYLLHRDFRIWRENYIDHKDYELIYVRKSVLANKKEQNPHILEAQEHLAYKLGRVMIENSKSLFGYIRMPYVLSYINDKHKQDKDINSKKIYKNCKNCERCLRVKKSLSYKLGEALIANYKKLYWIGFFKFCFFDSKKIRKEHKRGK